MTGDSNPLSKREQEILTLVARGLTNQEIAKELVISPNTVKVHLRNIFAKLEVASRTEAIVKAAQAGWIDVPGLEEETTAEQAALPALARPPLALWQRLWFVAAAALVAIALLLPGWVAGRRSLGPVSDFSDAGLVRLGVPARNQSGRWKSVAALPVARSRLALAATDGALMAIGGETADGVTDAVDIYDPQTNGWLPGNRKPTAIANAGAAVVDGLIYVPGGTQADGTVTAALEVYDPAADVWTARASMPRPLTAYALAALDGRLYLFGGWDGATFVDTVLTYDSAADVWVPRSPLPEAVGFAAAAALPDRIVVIGGYDGVEELSACRAYYPDEDRWEACAPLIQPRAGLGAAVDGTSIYAIGGGWSQSVAFNERYDSLNNTWSSIPTPVQGQWRNLGVAGVGAAVYAVGGWSGDYLDANEEYQTTFRSFLPFGARGAEDGDQPEDGDATEN